MSRSDSQERIAAVQARLAQSDTKDARRRVVVVEEGPRRGQVGGFHTDHADGRLDATVFAPALNIKTKAQEI